MKQNAQYIAGEIRAELARQGKAQRDLAEHFDVSLMWVSARLAGKVEFKVSQLMQVAAYLGVPVTQFLPRTEPARRAS